MNHIRNKKGIPRESEIHAVGMRYQGAEKLEIIRLVERSHLSVRWTLDQIGIPCATFYRGYDLYRTGGPEALEDRPSHPGRVWNRIPDEIRGRIVLDGLRGDDSIAELCRREGINQNLYYRCSKEFLEAGKKRLAGDTAREATSEEVKGLRRQAGELKEVVAERMLENRLLKKSMTGDGGDEG